MWWPTPERCSCVDILAKEKDEPDDIKFLNEANDALSRQISGEIISQISPKIVRSRQVKPKNANPQDAQDDMSPKSPSKISTEQYLTPRELFDDIPPSRRQMTDPYADCHVNYSDDSDCSILFCGDDPDFLFTSEHTTGCTIEPTKAEATEAPMASELMIKTLSSGGGRKANVAKALHWEAEAFISRIKAMEPLTKSFQLRGVSRSGCEWGADLVGSTLTQITRGTMQHAATHLAAANLDVSSPEGSVLSQPSALGLQKKLEAVKNLGPIADNKLDCIWQVTSTSLYTKLSGKKKGEAVRVSIIDMSDCIVILIRSAPSDLPHTGFPGIQELHKRPEQNFVGVLLEPVEDGCVETMLCQTTAPQAFRYLWRMTPSAALRLAFAKEAEQLLMWKNELAERAAGNDPTQPTGTWAPSASAGKARRQAKARKPSKESATKGLDKQAKLIARKPSKESTTSGQDKQDASKASDLENWRLLSTASLETALAKQLTA